jgi:hypothetical protein
MYKVSMGEARRGTLCPDTFLPALMIGVMCSRFRLSVNVIVVANSKIVLGTNRRKLKFALGFAIRHHYHIKCARLLSQLHLSFFL